MFIAPPSRIQVWQIVSVGEKVKTMQVGDRVLVPGSVTVMTLEGRDFACFRADSVVALLQLPPVQEEPRVVLTDAQGAMLS